MSVQINTYLLCGVRLPYEDEGYAKYEEYCDSAFGPIEHVRGLCVLYDGMDGEFIFVGRVLEKTANYEAFEAPMCVDLPEDSVICGIKAALKREFGIVEEPKMWIVPFYR